MVENNIRLTGFDELEKVLTEIIALLKDSSKVFAETKLIMFQDVMNHFKQEEGPDGKWTPLSKFTLMRRHKEGKGAKILQDSGRLIDSITAVHDRHGAEVGTNVPYAKKHQKGDRGPLSGNIDARPFLWLSEKAKQRIADRFILALKQAGK